MPRPLRSALLSLSVLPLIAACGSTVSSAQIAGAGDGVRDGIGPQAGAPGASSAPLTGGSLTTSSPLGTVSPGPTGRERVGASTGAVTPGAHGSALAGSSTGPLEIGVVLTNIGSAADYGFDTGESLSEQKIDQALFDAINKRGGLAGHKVQPVYAKTDPNSGTWATEFARACATFTQDHHVAAVLGYQFTYDTGFEACLTKKGVPHLTTGFNIPDEVELKQHPLHRSLAVPTIDKRSMAKLSGAIADGVLTKSSTLALIVDGCPGSQRSWKSVAEPYLKAQGIKVGFFYQGGCSGGSAGGASGASDGPNALLKMRQAGVDIMTFLTVSEGPLLAVIAPAAQAQNWYPTYLTSSLANLSTLEVQSGSTVPPQQLENVKSYGWMPSQDVGTDEQPALTPGQKRCLSLLRSEEVVPAQVGDRNNAFRICDAVFAYEAALIKAAGVSAGSAVISALDRIGTSFNSPDVLDGATRFGPGLANNAPAHVRAVVWDKTKKHFVYRGATRSFP